MFAKRVFQIAGWSGFVELIPLLFLSKTSAAATQPALYYGFLGVTLAWQILFLVVAADPVRYRPLMIPAMCEKGAYVLAVGFAESVSKPPQGTLVFAGIDFIWLLLFAFSYMKTPSHAPPAAP